jgi:ATP-binding cassette subfamily C protein
MSEMTNFGSAEDRGPTGNAPFFVNDPSSVWLVHGAPVDLFLIRMLDAEPAGARHHLLRVEPGEAIFGIDHSVHEQFGIVAIPATATRLDRLGLDSLLGDAGSGGLAYLERWIEHVAEAASTSLPPASFVSLQAGTELSIGEEPKALLPLDGVAWVMHEQGESRFLDLAGLPLLSAAEGLFPVTRYGWIQAAPDARVRSVDVSHLSTLTSCGDGLQSFHKLAVTCLIHNLTETERKQVHRLKVQAQADVARVESALLQLAAPLGRASESDRGEASFGRLMIAAQAVGKAAGISIKPHPDLLRGVSLKSPVAAIARTSRIRARRVVLKAKWWTHDSGPILAFRDTDNSPVALLPSSPSSYDLFDPESGSTTPVDEKQALQLNGFAYTFYRPFPAARLDAVKLLLFGAAQAPSDISMILLMGIASGLLAMVAPIATGIIFDTVIPGAQRSQLLTLTLFLVVSAVCTALFNIARGFATLRLEGKMDAIIQAAVWDRLLALPVPFFRDYSSGDLASRSMGINQIRGILTGSTLTSILTGVFSVFSFALLFYYSVPLAILATLLTGFAFLVATTSGYLQVRHQREMSRIGGRLSGMVLQFIHGIAKFRVSGTEHRAFAAWAREYGRKKQLAVKARTISNRLAAFNAMFPVVCTALVFYFAASLRAQPGSALSTGAFLAFLAAFVQFMMAALQLSSSVVAVLGIVPLYERAKPILQTLPEVSDAQGNPGELLGEIEVNHLAFRYRPDTPYILRDISLSILPGQFAAIVGPSGCGKSTLLRLLLGFEQPESGAIYLDRQDLAGLDLQAVRQQMGVVLQSAKLFSGSIFSNIVGSAPLTEADAWEAARLSGLDEDVRGMPMGMHTAISDGGGGLSGGQRQRLLIARAIVRKPRIILFDEATSALDNRTQATVSRSLESLQSTRIVIAHRLSTIVKADRIFVLDQGRVVQCGAYQELMNQPGPFRELAKRQIV